LQIGTISKKAMNTKTKSIEDRRSALNATGMRVTNQRALILEILRDGHLDADEIYRRARVRQPRISLSTIYRTLHTLKELGLVEELHLDETHHHYEVKPSVEHHHLVCLGCGSVIEFRFPLIHYIKKKVTEAKGFEIVDAKIQITGYCPKCRKNRT